MGNHSFKSVRLFLKLILLFQIYSHHKFEAEATQTQAFILKSFEGIYKSGDGAGKRWNDQISEKQMEDVELETQKRPARLLPLKMFL